MHEDIYFENSIPVAWPYYSKFCTNSQIFTEHPHSRREVCSAGSSPFPHATMENRTVFLHQGHA